MWQSVRLPVGLAADMLPAVGLQYRPNLASPAEVVAWTGEEFAAVARHGPCVRSGGRSRLVARPAPGNAARGGFRGFPRLVEFARRQEELFAFLFRQRGDVCKLALYRSVS